MGFSTSAPPLPDSVDLDWLGGGKGSDPSPGSHSFARNQGDVKAGEAPRNQYIDWLGGNFAESDSGSRTMDMSEPSKRDKLLWF